MKELTKAIIAGAILGGSLGLIANYSHAATTGGAVASADHGHHGYGNGVSGSLKGAGTSTASAGQSGQGGPESSMVDDFQPWPESEMRQFQKPKFIPYGGQ